MRWAVDPDAAARQLRRACLDAGMCIASKRQVSDWVAVQPPRRVRSTPLHAALRHTLTRHGMACLRPSAPSQARAWLGHKAPRDTPVPCRHYATGTAVPERVSDAVATLLAAAAAAVAAAAGCACRCSQRSAGWCCHCTPYSFHCPLLLLLLPPLPVPLPAQSPPPLMLRPPLQPLPSLLLLLLLLPVLLYVAPLYAPSWPLPDPTSVPPPRLPLARLRPPLHVTSTLFARRPHRPAAAPCPRTRTRTRTRPAEANGANSTTRVLITGIDS